MAEHDLEESPAQSAGRSRWPGLVALVVLVAAVIVFVVQNSQAVTVKFWFVTSRPRLIWVIAGCLAIGAILGFVAGRARRGRSRHRD